MHREAVEQATKSVDTGRLRASISYSVEGEPAVRTQASVENSQENDSKIQSLEDMAVVGTNVEYALKIEFGGSKRQGPDGYLRPALDKTVPTIQTVMQDRIKKALGGA